MTVRYQSSDTLDFNLLSAISPFQLNYSSSFTLAAQRERLVQPSRAVPPPPTLVHQSEAGEGQERRRPALNSTTLDPTTRSVEGYRAVAEQCVANHVTTRCLCCYQLRIRSEMGYSGDMVCRWGAAHMDRYITCYRVSPSTGKKISSLLSLVEYNYQDSWNVTLLLCM